MSKIRLFVGSGEASLLERKTFIHSARQQTRREMDIYVFNGTHNAVELNGGEPFLAPMSLKVKYRNVTEFSLYRFLIPQICNFEGKAIFTDSDMVCLGDIGELFDTPMNGCDILAKKDAYKGKGWGLSVMVIDCARARFDLEEVVREMDAGLYDYTDFTNFRAKYLERHPLKIGEIDPKWNVFDYCDPTTKLIHYTNLYTQPWKHAGHPFEDLWFRHFEAAQAAGAVKPRDIELSLLRSYVRRDIRKRKNLAWNRLKSRVKYAIKPPKAR